MEKITKRHPILNYGKSKIYVVTFQELYQVKNILHIPDIQSDLNQDKVNDMIESFNNNYHFMASKCLITIAKVVIGDEIEYCIIDGQHRFSMIMQMLENKELGDSILISLIEVNSQQELKQLFEEINSDSSKCIYKNLTIFDKEIYENLKMKLKTEFSFAPIKSSHTSKVYSIAQLVTLLIDNQIIEKIRQSDDFKTTFNIDSIIKYLKEKEKSFLIKCQYLELLHSKPNDFKKDEQTQLKNKSCIFIKNNNFFEWLFDNSIIPNHDFNFRPHISKTLKKQVWEKEFGSNSNGLCPIIGCRKILDWNVENSWHCGHLISHFHGGETSLDNLRPICPSCNKTMNYRNWIDYEDELAKQMIYSTYFNNNDLIICLNENCTNKIQKENYKYLVYTDNLPRPWCRKCYNEYTSNEEDDTWNDY